jgi:hypothetical protein
MEISIGGKTRKLINFWGFSLTKNKIKGEDINNVIL